MSGIGADAEIASTLRESETSHRAGDLQQGIHPSDHFNQASAASSGGDVGSTASAQPQRTASTQPQRTASTHASAHPRIRTHAPERATTPRWTLAMIDRLGDTASAHSGADTAVAPSRQPKQPDRAGGQSAATPAISAAALEHEKIEREEKAARRGDTSDNGRNSKWAK